MLPSKSELNLAKKCNFDLYTITNLSFWDIAFHMRLNLNVYAVSKSDLKVRDEKIESLSKIETFTNGRVASFDSCENKGETHKHQHHD